MIVQPLPFKIKFYQPSAEWPVKSSQPQSCPEMRPIILPNIPRRWRHLAFDAWPLTACSDAAGDSWRADRSVCQSTLGVRRIRRRSRSRPVPRCNDCLRCPQGSDDVRLRLQQGCDRAAGHVIYRLLCRSAWHRAGRRPHESPLYIGRVVYHCS